MWSGECSLFHMLALFLETISHLGIPFPKFLDIGVLDFHSNPFATNLLTGSFPLNLLVYKDIETTCFTILVHSYNLERAKWSHKSARPFMTDISVFYFRLENIKHRT